MSLTQPFRIDASVNLISPIAIHEIVNYIKDKIEENTTKNENILSTKKRKPTIKQQDLVGVASYVNGTQQTCCNGALVAGS